MQHAKKTELFSTQVVAVLSSRRALLILLVCLALSLLLAWRFQSYAERDLTAELGRVTGERLTLYVGTLHSALDKYNYLPHILANNAKVRQLLTENGDPQAVNLYLEDINAAAGSLDLFILDREGNTVATSNWNRPGSFAGHKYRYRPYYQDALAAGRGTYFGVGATTGRPGFFITQAVYAPGVDPACRFGRAHDRERVAGVAVTKVDLSMLQREWRAGGETVFITDVHGVVFLSSNDAWRYRSLRPLEPDVQAAVLEQRQYGPTPPAALDARFFRRFHLDMMALGGQDWLYARRRVEPYGWDIWFLKPAREMTDRQETLWLISAGGVALVALAALLGYAFFAVAQARREAHEAQRIRAVNQRLASEVRRRKKTERELLAAQDDLLHAGQLAALGQVAASVAHELSQPVTSMRMFIVSCRRLVQDGRYKEVESTTGHIMELVQRLEGLIGQLRHFSRKASMTLGPVRLAESIENALSVLHFRAEAMACVPTRQCPEDAVVWADALQLEQVLINIIHNALDALDAARKAAPAEAPPPAIDIRVRRDDTWCVISIEDNGPGIPPEAREHIFKPFFSTKRSGEGIGLGLSIVDKVIRALHGEIRAEDVQPHGTRFVLRLPRVHNGTGL